MSNKVVKFGGTSMATSDNILRCADIVNSETSRRFIVVSAPGKRNSGDRKITDMLYACYHEVDVNGECKATFDKIRSRYEEIASELGLDVNIVERLNEVEEGLLKYRSAEYAASRGEYLGGVIMAGVLNAEFVDAAEVIKFSSEGEFDSESTNDALVKRLSAVGKDKRVVIPGFYGADSAGIIHTFSRGGSDVTGALVARAVKALVYENWTDVNGFMVADPRIIENPETINELSYRELRELAYMGANVLHPESIFPVRYNNIPINIKNTFNPEHSGTMIVADRTKDGRTITGIAGKKNYSIVFIEKSMMNSELGFARRVLSVFEYYGITFEHMPSGIDTLSVVISDSELAGKEEVVLDRIKKTVNPDHIEIMSGFSLIATVGHGMFFKAGTAARLCRALANANVNIRMIDQGSSELNIIVGVDTDDYDRAIRAIYGEFVH